MDNIFFEISTLMAMTVSIAFFIRLLKQPLIIAYIVAGIIAGPMFFNILHGDKHSYEAFAQFGVVLLLFIIGLNLDFKHLKSIGRASFITGIGQVVFTSIIGFGILLWLGFSLLSSVFLAISITFSSTIIIMKLLSDKKETDTVYGRHTIGLMLVQDIIAVTIMIVIGVLKDSDAIGGFLTLFIAKGLACIILIFLASRYLIPRILNLISDSSELLFIFTISWCFGLATLLHLAGFSIEIGAIVAGIALSSSPYQMEIASRIKPLRDFFLVIFFIVLGSEMAMNSAADIWLPSVVLSLFILIGNPLILYVLFRRLRFTRRNSFLAGLTAAQVSEFGFVVLFTASNFSKLDESVVPVFTIVAITTMFSSSYLIIYSEKLYQWLLPIWKLFGEDRYRQIEKIPSVYDIWVVGYHRIGIRVSHSLKRKNAKLCVIDFDPEAIAELRKRRIPAVYGDISDVEFLDSLPLAGAKLIVITAPGLDDQVALISHLQRINPKMKIIANAYSYDNAKILYSIGASYVMMPHLLGADMISELLTERRLTKKLFDTLRDEQLSKVDRILPA